MREVKICPQCQTENRAEARFCSRCGRSLAAITPLLVAGSGSTPQQPAPPVEYPDNGVHVSDETCRQREGTMRIGKIQAAALVAGAIAIAGVAVAQPRGEGWLLGAPDDTTRFEPRAARVG